MANAIEDYYNAKYSAGSKSAKVNKLESIDKINRERNKDLEKLDFDLSVKKGALNDKKVSAVADFAKQRGEINVKSAKALLSKTVSGILRGMSGEGTLTRDKDKLKNKADVSVNNADISKKEKLGSVDKELNNAIAQYSFSQKNVNADSDNKITTANEKYISDLVKLRNDIELEKKRYNASLLRSILRKEQGNYEL